MDDDMAKIEDWAQVFTEPATLAKKVSKNWLLHGVQVKEDIAEEQADWSSGAYFNAGKDAAAAIELLVPFESAVEEYGLNLKGDAKFVAGFIYGMVGDNHLTEIEQCYTSTEPLITDVENFMHNLENLKIIAAFEDLEKFVFNFQMDLAPCKNVSDDIASIKAWADQFKDIKTLISTISKHALVHMKGIKKDIASEKADWSAGNYFKAGADIADAVTLALGPMSEAPPMI